MTDTVGAMRKPGKKERKKHGPPATPLTIEKTSDGCRIVLPRVGVTYAGHGIFWIGLCFCVGIGFLSWVFFALGEEGHAESKKPEDLALIFLVLGGFWVVSLGTVLFGINMGLRRGTIEVTADFLRIHSVTPFSTKVAEFPRASIMAIQRGPTGLSVGGTKGTAGLGVDELHVYTEGKKRHRFFAGRNTRELEDVAEHLREALGVGTTRYDGG